MRKTAFYPKLAAQNIRRSRQFYLPFILTCILTTAMFYIMCFLTYNPATVALHPTLYFILQLGCIVIGLFSAIFLFYTNSFLMKRRQKEIGLYNILGMGKGNIAGVLFFETLYITLISLVCGLGLGILLSKLMLLILFKLVSFPVPYGFEVSVKGMTYSAYLFCGIFAAILLSNLVRIRLANPIELMRGSVTGEKEPKTKVLLALLGLIALGAGYWIAITTESPLAAIYLFFVAVLLVIAGTYLLFTSGSIALLKRLKKKTSYYYTTRHFIPVSGMLYRMKQNAVGLANICILATMVLVMVSGTACLYLGTEDAMRNLYPTDIVVEVKQPAGSARENLRETIKAAVSDSGLQMESVSDFVSLSFSCTLDNGAFSAPSSYVNTDQNAEIYLVSSAEYARMSGKEKAPASGDAFVYTDLGKPLGKDFTLLDKTYSVTQTLESFPSVSQRAAMLVNRYFIVLSDEDYAFACAAAAEILPEWYWGFNLTGTSAEKIACRQRIDESVSALSLPAEGAGEGHYERCNVISYDANSKDYYAMIGGFLFLGLFLGLIFLIATVLIIYYKQLSEGYDDKSRFEIMQKVGLSRPEIRKAIRSQVLVVFFLPLGMAVIHIAFAFKMITKLLLVFSLTNVGLFAVCTLSTVAVFALIYGAVYLLTAKAYYKVVS